MVSFDDSQDAFDDSNDPEAAHPPTPEEQAQMLEHISVAQAIALLRERGYRVEELEDAS